jgi:hypothetical protein
MLLILPVLLCCALTDIPSEPHALAALAAPQAHPVPLVVFPDGSGGVAAFPQPERTVDCVPPALRDAIRADLIAGMGGLVSPLVAQCAPMMGPGGAGTLEQLAIPPLLPFNSLAGNVYEDVFPGGFVDLDPGGGVLDFACGALANNGHAGHDIGLRSFTEQAIGVPVFSIADGVVLFSQDGFADMNVAPGPDGGNYLIIDHGLGRTGWYFHLKKNSVAFGVGQMVKQGDQLGLAASSGFSYGPHLHFGLEQSSVVQEPHAGPCGSVMSRWAKQDPLLLAPKVLEFGVTITDLFTGGLPAQFEQPKHNQIPLNAGFTYYWMHLANVPANAKARMLFYAPNGTLSQDTGDFDFPYAGNPYIRWWPGFLYLWVWGMQDTPGTWHYKLQINGVQVLDAPVEVVATVNPTFNRPPEPITAAFEPPTPTPEAALFCRVGASVAVDDLDWDIVRYRYLWKVNGATVRDITSAARSDALPRASFAAGQTVACTVTPNDGKVNGTPVIVSAAAAGDPWAAIGGGKYGNAGVPWLQGAGTLAPSSVGTLGLGQARPNSPALLFIGPAAVQVPFKGGTLVPFPVPLTVALNTGPTGGFTLPFTWPAGVPGGFQVALQLWVQDAAGLLGSSSTNGVLITAP